MKHLAPIMLLALLAVGWPSCGPRLPYLPKVGTPAAHRPSAPPLPANASVDELRRAREEALSQRDEADQRAKALERRISEERQDARARMLDWMGLGCIVLTGLCVCAAIWLPIGRKTAIAFAAMFATMAGLAFTLSEALEWLPWAMLAIAVVGALVALVHLAPHLRLLELLKPHLGDVAHKLDDAGQALANRVGRKR